MRSGEVMAMLWLVPLAAAVLALCWGASWRQRAKELEIRYGVVKDRVIELNDRLVVVERRAARLIKQLNHSIKYIKGEV